MGKKMVTSLGRVLLLIILLALITIGVFYIFAPVYDFKTPQQFGGNKIYNPYQHIDTVAWKKANFHCHTIASDGKNRLGEVQKAYKKYGYDILAISDHNLITKQGLPADEEIPAYEHGVNISMFHSVVIGARHGSIFDFVLLSTESNRYYTLRWLRSQGDIVVFDHPDRTRWLVPEDMNHLSYYNMMEVERGYTGGYLGFYDQALSNGHYSYVLASDDCHDVNRGKHFATAATFVATPTKKWKDVKEALLAGRNYAITIPNFKDTAYKLHRSWNLPRMKSLTLRNDSLEMVLSEPATIRVFGHSGIMEYEYNGTTEAKVPFLQTDTFLRFVAIFPDSVILYTNPIARYKGGAFPQFQNLASVNYPLTALYILLLASVVLFLIWLLLRLVLKMLPKRAFQKSSPKKMAWGYIKSGK